MVIDPALWGGNPIAFTPERNRAVDTNARSPANGSDAEEIQALRRLNAAGARLWQARSMLQGLQEMLAATIELLGADMGNVQILDVRQSALHIAAQQGFGQEFLEFFHTVDASENTACGRALRGRVVTVIEDIEQEPSFAPYRQVARDAGFRAVVSMPLIGPQSNVVGVLSAHFRQAHQPTASDLEQLSLYARVAAAFIDRWQSDEASLRENEERLRLALDVGRLATWDWDLAADSTVWNAQHYRLLGYDPADVNACYDNWARRVHPGDYVEVANAYQAAMQSREEFALQYRIIRPDGMLRWCAIKGRFLYDDGAVPVRMVAIVDDITERKRMEESQRVLVAELQHRTRNLLTIVQSIAVQTMETTQTREQFEDRFLDRLLGLSRVLGLLSRQSIAPITLETLLRMELDAFCSEADYRKVLIAGPPVPLNSHIAQSLALGIHELTTNALKHGALSSGCDQGRLSVTWRVQGEPPTRMLSLDWLETQLTPRAQDAAPNGHGYGRILIEEELPYTLSAQTTLELAGDSLRCSISIPLD